MNRSESRRALGLVLISFAACRTSLDDVRAWAERCDRSALLAGLDAPKSWMRREAALGAGRCELAPARPRLEALAGDPGEPRWVRAAAARALGRLRAESSLPLLVGLAADPKLEPEVQVAVIGALERYGACPALEPLAAADEPLVAARARVALRATCAVERAEG
jgi:HEAT repeat protein